jgi:hypothetical protein
MKTISISIQHVADNILLAEILEATEEVAKHFQSVYSNPCSLSSSAFLSSDPIFKPDYFRIFKCLRPPKSCALYCILVLLLRNVLIILCTDFRFISSPKILPHYSIK